MSATPTSTCSAGSALSCVTDVPRTVGVDIGGTKVLGVVVDTDAPERGPLAEARRPTPQGAESLVATIATVVAEVLGPDGADGVAAVGVGLPGLIDRGGVLRFGPNLPGIVDLDLEHALADRVALPVVVENDANCAAWAEHRLGAAEGHGHVLLVTLGTGIGAGLIADGRLFTGAHGMAGEPGHMIVDPGGPRCPCGRRGCWERYASGSGLGFLAREAALAGRAQGVVALAGGDPEAVRGEHVTRAARQGDPDASTVMESFGWWVALGLANLVNILDPEIVVLGGGLVTEADLFLSATRAAFADLVLAGPHRHEVPVVAASTGERAGALGAALLAAERGWGAGEATR